MALRAFHCLLAALATASERGSPTLNTKAEFHYEKARGGINRSSNEKVSGWGAQDQAKQMATNRWLEEYPAEGSPLNADPGSPGAGSDSDSVRANQVDGRTDSQVAEHALADLLNGQLKTTGDEKGVDTSWIESMLAGAAAIAPTPAPTFLVNDDDDDTGRNYGTELHMQPWEIVAISWAGALLTALILKCATMVWLWRDHGLKAVRWGDKSDIDPKTEVKIVLCGDVSDIQPLRPSAGPLASDRSVPIAGTISSASI
jgi:hypothetical protein